LTASSKSVSLTACDGDFRATSRITAQSRTSRDSEKILYHPAGEAHSDKFGNRGGAIFSIELEPRWTSTLREYELQSEEPIAFPHRQVSWLGRRAYQAFINPSP